MGSSTEATQEAAAATRRACVVVLATGGTIAGLSAGTDPLRYTAAQIGVEGLVPALPSWLDGVAIEPEQVAQIDSKDMDADVWQRLALRCEHHLARHDVAGIVVTHGTDTLEETAYFLHRVLAATKPVVLTGAMRPADAAGADGPANLIDAITLAATAAARGVLVAFARAVHHPASVRKLHPTRVDAFGSGDEGPLARIDEAGRVVVMRAWPDAAAMAAQAPWRALDPARWPRVWIVPSHAGADAAPIDAAIAARVDGLVIETTGNGTMHHRLEAACARAVAAGVRVVRAGRCSEGALVDTRADAIGVAGVMSPYKARIDLLLALMNDSTRK